MFESVQWHKAASCIFRKPEFFMKFRGRRPIPTAPEFPAQFAGISVTVPGFARRGTFARSSCPQNGYTPRLQMDVQMVSVLWYTCI